MLRNVRGIALILATVVGMASFSVAQTRASVTVTGAERSSGASWDSGVVRITVNGYAETVAYGQFSSPASIASAVAAKFSLDCAGPVNAKANGAVITFQLRARAGTSFTSMSWGAPSNDQANFPGGSFFIDTAGFPGAVFMSPVPPSGLRLTAEGYVITLAWSDNAVNEESYKILRCVGPDCTISDPASEHVMGLPPQSTLYSDPAVQIGTTYRYSVCAVNSAGSSCSPSVPVTDDVPAEPCP